MKKPGRPILTWHHSDSILNRLLPIPEGHLATQVSSYKLLQKQLTGIKFLLTFYNRSMVGYMIDVSVIHGIFDRTQTLVKNACILNGTVGL